MSTSLKKKMEKRKEKIVRNVDNPIFSFCGPTSNDSFSEMSGKDLRELLCLLEDYYLELRNRLGFNDDLSFGMEIEFEQAKYYDIKRKLESLEDETILSRWELVEDASLVNGGEIDSPVLYDKSFLWKEVSIVCDLVSEYAEIGPNSAGHIHIGSQVLGNKSENWLNFIKLWSVYENVIFRFLYGDKLNARPSVGKYARPMALDLWDDYSFLKDIDNLPLSDIVDFIDHGRYRAVNLRNVIVRNEHLFHVKSPRYKNTIEFRCPNGTLDPVVWQNNINMVTNLLKYSRSSNFDGDTIEKRKQDSFAPYLDLNFYEEVYLEQALELCDLIFTNNYDKIYFLRQYLKSFEISDEYKPAKQFTKVK